MLGLALKAQEAKPLSLDQAAVELGKGCLRRSTGKMRGVDAPHVGVTTGACCKPPFGGRAEGAQMHVADADTFQPGRELAFGKAGAARGGNRADIDQKPDAGCLQHG
jgi:hypothetical protein